MRWKIAIILFLPFTTTITFVESMEYYHIWEARNAPLVEGDVIRREVVESLGGFRHMGRMTIRIVDTNTLVIAETNSNDLKELPNRVQFHYLGDPTREVFVEGEEDPFWVALVTFLASIAIIWFCVLPLFPTRRKPGAREIHESSGATEVNVLILFRARSCNHRQSSSEKWTTTFSWHTIPETLKVRVPRK